VAHRRTASRRCTLGSEASHVSCRWAPHPPPAAPPPSTGVGTYLIVFYYYCPPKLSTKGNGAHLRCSPPCTRMDYPPQQPRAALYAALHAALRSHAPVVRTRARLVEVDGAMRFVPEDELESEGRYVPPPPPTESARRQAESEWRHVERVRLESHFNHGSINHLIENVHAECLLAGSLDQFHHLESMSHPFRPRASNGIDDFSVSISLHSGGFCRMRCIVKLPPLPVPCRSSIQIT
jgi:hypothetical protein